MQWTEEMGVELQRSEGARIAANGSLIGGLQVPPSAGQLWPRVGKPRRVLITTCVIVGLACLSTYFLTKNITAITNKLVKCAFLFQKISTCIP